MRIQTARLEMVQITNNDWELFKSVNRNPAVIRQCFNEPTLQEIKKGFVAKISSIG